MFHCLTKDELTELINLENNNSPIRNNELKTLVGNAESWMDELCALVYLFSQILESKSKKGEDCTKLIDLLYKLPDKLFLKLEEIDLAYINFMLRNVRIRSLTLEEELVEIENKLSNYEYAKTLRF